MTETIDIIIFDEDNKIIDKSLIQKPKNYELLLVRLKNLFPNFPKKFKIYYYSPDNNEITVKNEEDYKTIKDILYVKKLKSIAESIFTTNYKKIDNSIKEIINKKYNCLICSQLIKREKPYICNNCKKIYHHKCLEGFDKECKQNNQNFYCPNCKNELAIEKWRTETDFEDIRYNDALFMDLINEQELPLDYSEFIKKSSNIFQRVLNKIKEIHSLINEENNETIDKLIMDLELNYNAPSLGKISMVMFQELNIIEQFIKKNYTVKKVETKEEVKEIKKEKKPIEYKDVINLEYYSPRCYDMAPIFGKKFVKNNKNNIELIIDGNKSELVSEAKLMYKTDIKMIIKNKITNLSDLFGDVNENIKINIADLKYLNTKEVTNFSSMFHCILSNIDALEEWDVSSGKNFSNMFSKSNLKDLKILENWNVSNGLNFSSMFEKCYLTDLKHLKNWDLSKSENLSQMFSGCDIYDLDPLKDWNVSKVKNFSYMFSDCNSLNDITALEKWNVSNGNNFAGMFQGCSSLKKLKGLENWNMSNNAKFHYMFSNCYSLNDIKPLENWNVSNGIDFSAMFYNCCSLPSIKTVEKWNVSNGINFSCMFYKCSKIKDLHGLEKWDVSNGNYFSKMFYLCTNLKDINSLKKWNVSKGTEFKSMLFIHWNKLLDLKPIIKWKISKDNFKSLLIDENIIQN